MTPFDWTRFSLPIHLRSTPEKAFRAWATSRGLESFFRHQVQFTRTDGSPLPPDAFPSKGDQIAWTQYRGEAASFGRVVDIVENQLFIFKFDSDSVLVAITVEEAGDLSKVTLTQSNMPDTPDGRWQWHVSCRAGWAFFMTNLKSVLEHGTDLRESDSETTFDPGRFT